MQSSFGERHVRVTVSQTLWLVKILGSDCKQNLWRLHTLCVPKVKIISCCLANLALCLDPAKCPHLSIYLQKLFSVSLHEHFNPEHKSQCQWFCCADISGETCVLRHIIFFDSSLYFSIFLSFDSDRNYTHRLNEALAKIQ